MISGSIHFSAKDMILFFIVEQYSIIYIYDVYTPPFLIYSLVEGHLGWRCNLAILNSAAMNVSEKRNPYIFLVGMQISAATVQISMKTPQQDKNRATTWPRYTTPRYICEGIKVCVQRQYLHTHVYQFLAVGLKPMRSSCHLAIKFQQGSANFLWKLDGSSIVTIRVTAIMPKKTGGKKKAETVLNEWVWLYFNKILLPESGCGQFCPTGHSSLTPDLRVTNTRQWHFYKLQFPVGWVAYAYNPSYSGSGAIHEFEASLGKVIETLFQKQNKSKRSGA
jgi:hypothetical protein